MEGIETTELDRMAEVHEESQEIGRFLSWLSEQGMEIGEYRKIEGYRDLVQFMPVGRTINQMLADYFAIDLDKVEAERRAILEAIRDGRM